MILKLTLIHITYQIYAETILVEVYLSFTQ
jgi:hypothetical protein